MTGTRPQGNGGRHLDAAIVGAGFSGIGAAIALRQKTDLSLAVFERGSAVGGTWRDNDYPGCACDVPSHLYSYSFALEPRWTRTFAPRSEIRDYLERCVDRFGIRADVELGNGVSAARFDEDAGRWELALDSGERVSARYLILGVGPLRIPRYPVIDGRERFAGPAFHSSRWDRRVDLAGKRVAVIGTGASAIQIVPQLAGVASRLSVFQRTAPWILPRPDRAIGDRERRLYRAIPALQRLVRWGIYWQLELRALAFVVDPSLMRIAARAGLAHIEAQIADPELRRAVTPDFTPGCKRVLMADDYYPALSRPDVELVTAPIERVTEDSVVTATGPRPVDAIVYATGFEVTDFLSELPVAGRGGVDLASRWRIGAAPAYLGTTVAGFPNLFVMLGPNTGLGHTSMVFMIEAQLAHIVSCLREARRRGARTVEVRAERQRAFNGELEPRLARTVWASGCNSWYLDERGRNITNWPGFTAEYWWRTRRINPADYRFR